MRKKLALLAVALAAVLLAAIFFLQAPGSVPAGQPPLTTLASANAAAFERTFDADANLPRLVLLLSPT